MVKNHSVADQQFELHNDVYVVLLVRNPVLTSQSPKDSREVSYESRSVSRKLMIVSERSVQVKKGYHQSQTSHYITKPPPSIGLLRDS